MFGRNRLGPQAGLLARALANLRSEHLPDPVALPHDLAVLVARLRVVLARRRLAGLLFLLRLDPMARRPIRTSRQRAWYRLRHRLPRQCLRATR